MKIIWPVILMLVMFITLSVSYLAFGETYTGTYTGATSGSFALYYNGDAATSYVVAWSETYNKSQFGTVSVLQNNILRAGLQDGTWITATVGFDGAIVGAWQKVTMDMCLLELLKDTK